MVEEILQHLQPVSPRAFLDLTLGGGGHTREILRSFAECAVLGVDRDPEAVEAVRRSLASFGARFRAVVSRFDRAGSVEGGPNENAFDALLLDLGVSSMQLDDPRRGFRFESDCDLDMRMDPREGESAAAVLERVGEEDLTAMLRELGDERRAAAIARAIVERRRSAPLRRSAELAQLVSRVAGGGRPGAIHPATRTFQALRMVVNDEVGCLTRVLPEAAKWLRPGGMALVLSYHSGEDRRVKQFFREGDRQGEWQVVTRKPQRPTEAETRRNRRARSARLRVATRLGVSRDSESIPPEKEPKRN